MKTLSAIVVCIAMMSLAPRCTAQTELVSDDFAGTNGTYLGSNWTGCGYNQGAYSKLVYESNAAGGSGYWSQDCALYTGYGVFPSDQYATATVVAPVPSFTPQASLELRANATPSTSEAYIACGWNAEDFPADYHYRIWSVQPNPPTGGPTSLWLSNITPATNDVISCQVLGNIITMSLNGQKIATVTDTSGLTSGYPGIYYNDVGNSGGPSPTDVIFANFQAGSGPPVVSTSITPQTATVPAGSFVQYSGTITYSDGTVATMSNWSSTDTTVGTVDITGTAYGTGPGTATLTGYSGPDSVSGTMNVVAPDGYTPLVHDTFVGTGGYLGSNWTGCGYSGGSYSELVYENNQAGGSGYWSQDCSLYTGYGTFPNDQYATALVVDPSPSSTPEASLELRANANPGSPESYIACGWDAQDFPSDNHYRIWSLGNSTYTSLYLSNITPATNDVIWCQVLGSTVTMQVNGTTIAVVNDVSGLTSGYPGMFYIDPNGDVPPITDVIFDNFAAGSINNPVLATVAVNPSSASTTVPLPVQFSATGTYTDGTTTSVTNSVNWLSSDPSVATVSSSGLATPVSAGTTTITATSGTVGGTATLKVNQLLLPTVTFVGAPLTAAYNSSFTVTATTTASTLPQITGTPGVCTVGAVSGTPLLSAAQVTMISGTGTCSLTASWAADASYHSATLVLSTLATKIASTTSITSDTPNPSTLQQAVTIGFSAAGAGAGPTGSVTVTASTGESCTGTLSSSHAGSCSITFRSAGSRTLSARYGGDGNFNSSTSAGVSQAVNSPTVSLSATSISFGTVKRGSSSTKSETVTNTGTGALINFSWSITGTNANRFSVSSTTCGTAPATLNPGRSCILYVTFKPAATGSQTATLVLTDNAPNSPQSVALSGSGK
jgi:uncharacterized protein YjdB